MQGSSLLSLAIWVPLVAGFAVLTTGSDRHAGVARVIALTGALLGFLVTLPLYAGFDPTERGFQLCERVSRDSLFHREREAADWFHRRPAGHAVVGNIKQSIGPQTLARSLDDGVPRLA